jgi:hypothetical protein
LVGKRANLPVAALPLLAALTPPEHQITLIDENVERSTMIAARAPISWALPECSCSVIACATF